MGNRVINIFVVQTPIEVPDIIALALEKPDQENIVLVPEAEPLCRFLDELNIFTEVRPVSVVKRSHMSPISYMVELVKQIQVAKVTVRGASRLYYASYIKDLYTSSLVAASIAAGLVVVKLKSQLDHIIPTKRSKSISGTLKCYVHEIILTLIYKRRWWCYERNGVYFPVFRHASVEEDMSSKKGVAERYKKRFDLDKSVAFFISPLEGDYGEKKFELTIEILTEFSRFFDVVVFPHPRERSIHHLEGFDVRIIDKYVPASMIDMSKVRAVLAIDSAAIKEIKHGNIYSFARLQERYDSGEQLINWLKFKSVSQIKFPSSIQEAIVEISNAEKSTSDY